MRGRRRLSMRGFCICRSFGHGYRPAASTWSPPSSSSDWRRLFSALARVLLPVESVAPPAPEIHTGYVQLLMRASVPRCFTALQPRREIGHEHSRSFRFRGSGHGPWRYPTGGSGIRELHDALRPYFVVDPLQAVRWDGHHYLL